MKPVICETCRFCGANVEPGTMGYHYAGFQQPACPDVRMALDPTWWPTHTEREVISDEDRAKRKAAGVQRRREILRQQQAIALDARKRRSPTHEGMRL